MKNFKIILLFLFCTLSAQKELPFDALRIREVKDFFADDYGNVYLCKNKDFSVTKYDSLGKQQGKLMLTLPFKIQSVQNPLNIVLFSENAQQMMFVDANLNEIQKIDIRKFGFIKMAYAEDQQQIWLLDESMKRLVQYNFRDDKVINSFPFDMNFEDFLDMHVFENNLYLLKRDEFSVYSFKANKVFSKKFENAVRLRRENDRIYIIERDKIHLYLPDQSLQTVFQKANTKIVDKNSVSFYEISSNKLYLYRIEK